MALPKFGDLSATIQVVVILVVGAALWGVSEYLGLQPLKASNATKQKQADQLEKEVAPLRPFREKVRALEADNRQLENQLENLRRIVPNEKEVDNFVRLLQGQAISTGVLLRRISSKNPVQQQYYIEVPFEMELDGTFFDVMQFYDRLGKVERITNVSDLKMGGIQSDKGAGKKYDFSPNETVSAICTVTTFFSTEEQPETAAAAGAKGRPAPKGRAPAKPPARPTAKK